MESTATLPDRKFICFVTKFVLVDNNAINEIQPYIFLAWVTRIIFDIVYFRAQIINGPISLLHLDIDHKTHNQFMQYTKVWLTELHI